MKTVTVGERPCRRVLLVGTWTGRTRPRAQFVAAHVDVVEELASLAAADGIVIAREPARDLVDFDSVGTTVSFAL